MRDHSMLSGTAGLAGSILATEMLMKINAQNAVRIILKIKLSCWSVPYVKRGFMTHAFMLRTFV